MKKMFSLLTIVLSSSTFLLVGCHTHDSSKKSKRDHTPKSTEVVKSKKEKKNNKTAKNKSTADKAVRENSSENKTTTVQGSENNVQASQNISNTTNQGNVTATPSGNASSEQSKETKPISTGVSSVSGSWENSQGNQLSVDSSGKATWTYSDPYSENGGTKTVSATITITSIEGNVTYGNLSGFPVIMIPAGVDNPHDGSVVNYDRVLIGSTADADAAPYYRS